MILIKQESTIYVAILRTRAVFTCISWTNKLPPNKGVMGNSTMHQWIIKRIPNIQKWLVILLYYCIFGCFG